MSTDVQDHLDERTEENVATQLINLEMHNADLAVDVPRAVEDITVQLDALYQQGASESSLVSIQDSAQQLMSAIAAQEQAFQAALEIARTIQVQRDQTRKALNELKNALSSCDMSVPEIQDLHEALLEETEMRVMDYMWDTFAWDITESTGLNYAEAQSLLGLLTDIDYAGVLPKNHPVWDDLRKVMRTLEEVYEVNG